MFSFKMCVQKLQSGIDKKLQCNFQKEKVTQKLQCNFFGIAEKISQNMNRNGKVIKNDKKNMGHVDIV